MKKNQNHYTELKTTKSILIVKPNVIQCTVVREREGSVYTTCWIKGNQPAIYFHLFSNLHDEIIKYIVSSGIIGGYYLALFFLVHPFQPDFSVRLFDLLNAWVFLGAELFFLCTRRKRYKDNILEINFKSLWTIH